MRQGHDGNIDSGQYSSLEVRSCEGENPTSRSANGSVPRGEARAVTPGETLLGAAGDQEEVCGCRGTVNRSQKGLSGTPPRMLPIPRGLPLGQHRSPTIG